MQINYYYYYYNEVVISVIFVLHRLRNNPSRMKQNTAASRYCERVVHLQLLKVNQHRYPLSSGNGVRASRWVFDELLQV